MKNTLIAVIAGLAMARAVRALLPEAQVALKWPNDVLVDCLKSSGVLFEILKNRL